MIMIQVDSLRTFSIVCILILNVFQYAYIIYTILPQITSDSWYLIVNHHHTPIYVCHAYASLKGW